jgi:DNA repair photolyase
MVLKPARPASPGEFSGDGARLARKGRGAASAPDPRYLDERREFFDDGWGPGDDPPLPLKTTVTVEKARTIITRNDSPDIPFEQSINPYRGCEHGCIYCYARPSHAYLDLSPGLDFESKLFAKPDAAKLLRAELVKPGYRCTPLALGTNTDPYQPIERQWKITRAIIKLLAECHHPLTITTKSMLVERDIDLLAPLAERGLVEVYLSVTTLDHGLARRMEPRATAPRRRIETLRRLSEAGIPTGVMFAPVIPALNDSEMESVLAAAAEAGVRFAGYVILRLPHEIKDLFKEWLALHVPGRSAHVMSLIRELHGGKEYDSTFGVRHRGQGVFAELVRKRFQQACRRHGLNRSGHRLDTSQFRPPRPERGQLQLF